METYNPENSPARPPEGEQPRWRSLNRVQRRIAGVLVEKAKTTPEQYPLSLNALRSGCNQKSNRSPQMSLEAEEIEETIDQLRDMGAVIEVQGSGRVLKYKHCLYEWLGVDKTEIAVMAELLLRGEQTIGELRGRAARMEPISDLAALRPVLASLRDKGLLVELTPEGRGQIVSHALYEPAELEALKERASSATVDAPPPRAATRRTDAPPPHWQQQLDDLRSELQALGDRVAQLEQRLHPPGNHPATPGGE